MIHIGCVHWENVGNIQQDLASHCHFHQQDNIESIGLQDYQILLYRYSPQYADELSLIRKLNDANLPVIIATGEREELDRWIKENHVHNVHVIPPRLTHVLSAIDQVILEAKSNSEFEQDDLDFQPNYRSTDRAVRYIQENFQQKIKLQTLADLCYMSVVTFIRHFKKQHGVTPMDYVKIYRLNHAKELLQNSMLRISEISVQCGYKDPSFFIRAFHKHVGMTPSQYRRK